MSSSPTGTWSWHDHDRLFAAHQGSGRSGENRQQEVSEISRSLKALRGN